jgi:pyruvate/2-oxoglutarate dehydrogenase complex dihydrolipoamide acyltransferase (E2) component
MAHELRMPQLAQSVVEGEITRWLVKEGDSVASERPLAEITTDKVDIELPAPVGGVVLKILVPEGKTVPVGTLLAYIGQPGESLDSGVSPSSATFSSLTSSILGIDKVEARGTTSPFATPSADDSTVRATHAVRKLAQEMNIALGMVKGTGPEGRITREDVEKAASSRQTPLPVDSREVEYLPYAGRRKQIGQRLAHAKSVAPHASCVEEIDCSELVKLRADQKSLAESRGINLTYLPYVVCAAVRTLTKHPILNSSLEEEKARIAIKKYFNIGIAVDTPGGLIVPVIKDANRKGLLEIAGEIQSLSTRAREDQLSPEDVRDSTFTISSAGQQAGLFSIGILNYPEVALLNFHRIQHRPASVDGAIAARPLAYVTLTFDHRVFDGGEAVRFLADLKQRLEYPADWAKL